MATSSWGFDRFPVVSVPAVINWSAGFVSKASRMILERSFTTLPAVLRVLCKGQAFRIGSRNLPTLKEECCLAIDLALINNFIFEPVHSSELSTVGVKKQSLNCASQSRILSSVPYVSKL